MAIEATEPSTALIQNDIVLFGLIAATLGAVFWTSSRETGAWKRFYGVVPPLLLCYFIPGIFNSIGLIDGSASKLYNPVASRVLLPASLVLLTLTIDLKGVIGLGWKVLAMYFGASLTVMLGALVSFQLPASASTVSRPPRNPLKRVMSVPSKNFRFWSTGPAQRAGRSLRRAAVPREPPQLSVTGRPVHRRCSTASRAAPAAGRRSRRSPASAAGPSARSRA